MKYDLLLTEKGDLSFIASDTKYKNEMLEYNFHIAPTDSLCFKFNIENTVDDMIVPNKSTKPSKIDFEIETVDDIDTVIKPYVGMRVYVKDEHKTYIVTEVNTLELLSESDEIIKVDIVGDYKELEVIYSGNFTYEFFMYTPQYDKTTRMVKDKEYIQQAIRLRLSTEKGTMMGDNGGSSLFEFMHSNLDASRLLSQISSEVKSMISDILPNCTVSAYIINSDYLNYHDSIKIVIVNNEEVYYYYI